LNYLTNVKALHHLKAMVAIATKQLEMAEFLARDNPAARGRYDELQTQITNAAEFCQEFEQALAGELRPEDMAAGAEPGPRSQPSDKPQADPGVQNARQQAGDGLQEIMRGVQETFSGVSQVLGSAGPLLETLIKLGKK
jgi:hypothetical protein